MLRQIIIIATVCVWQIHSMKCPFRCCAPKTAEEDPEPDIPAQMSKPQLEQANQKLGESIRQLMAEQGELVQTSQQLFKENYALRYTKHELNQKLKRLEKQPKGRPSKPKI